VYALAADDVGPAELLTSDRMAAFLQEARATCDFVLLDAPAFPQVSDALVLTRWSDQVITVLRPGVSSKSATRQHLRLLRDQSPRHAIVLNDSEAIDDEARNAAPSRSFGERRPKSLAWAISALLAIGLLWGAWQARISAPRATSESSSPATERHALDPAPQGAAVERIP
jgi:Mrp family chromosome partitioning ATPase